MSMPRSSARRIWALPAAAITGLALGCGVFFGGLDGENVELEACAGSADIDAHARIGLELKESMHELVVCGGLTFKISIAATQAAVDLMVNSVSDATPSEFTYMGDGTFQTGSSEGESGTDMGLYFVFGADYEAGAAGTRIPGNIFVLDSYLTGASITVDDVTQTATIDYAEPGPIVELLGFGPTPDNPLVVDLADTLAISAELNKIRVAGDVVVGDRRAGVDVDYTVGLLPSPVANLLIPFAQLDYELTGASASSDLGQQLEIDEWTVEYVDEGGGALQGKLDFTVTGGEFDFAGELDYGTGSTYGELTLTCE
jgi:hypothetical protein